MGFKKAIEFTDTGATLEHHRICSVTVDRDAMQTLVSVKSYISKEKHSAGCNYVGYTQLTVPGIPESGADVFNWAEAKALSGEGSAFIGATQE